MIGQMMSEPDMLDAFFELNRQRIDAINTYCEGGGLERMVETAPEYYRLMDEQLRLIELMIRRDEQDKAHGR